jgi:hypothetical protein
VASQVAAPGAGGPTAAGSSSQAVTTKHNWLHFGGDSRHDSNNTLETQIAPQNVGSLQQLFKLNPPETIEYGDKSGRRSHLGKRAEEVVRRGKRR